MVSGTAGFLKEASKPDKINPDEPCYALTEKNWQTGKGWHRQEALVVVRNDVLVQWRTDMGSRTLWPGAEQLHILGGWTNPVSGRIEIEETIGRMRDMANQQRYNHIGEPERHQERIWSPADELADYYESLAWEKIGKRVFWKPKLWSRN